MNCYVCGRVIVKEQASELFLEDDDQRGVPAGPDCARRAMKLGAGGLSTRGGPRVFYHRFQARNYHARQSQLGERHG